MYFMSADALRNTNVAVNEVKNPGDDEGENEEELREVEK